MVKPDKSRYVWLYLPTRADKERWQALADEAKTPLSTFCISIIEERLADNEEFNTGREVTKELERLKKENKALRDDIRQKSALLELQESSLKKYRSAAFLEDDYRGMRPYSRELVEILKCGPIDNYRILEKLNIQPHESDQVKMVTVQLQELEQYGMIKTDGRTWLWIG